MRLWQAILSLGLFIFMSTSFALCLISGMTLPMQMECSHSGTSACSMHGEDCCLTESGKARVRTVERAPISVSHGRDFGNLQMPEEYS
jgi:hypothetical protein